MCEVFASKVRCRLENAEERETMAREWELQIQNGFLFIERKAKRNRIKHEEFSFGVAR